MLKHEQKVTASIHALYEVALAEKDYATQTFLQWFITEQVEEESSAEEVLAHLTALDKREHPLLILDRELAKRGSE